MEIIFVSAFICGKNERVIMVDVRMISKIVKGLIFVNRGFVKRFPSLSSFKFVNTSYAGGILNFTFLRRFVLLCIRGKPEANVA